MKLVTNFLSGCVGGGHCDRSDRCAGARGSLVEDVPGEWSRGPACDDERRRRLHHRLGNQNQIDAHVTTQGWKIGPNDVQIVESQSGNNVSIEVTRPPLEFFDFRRPPPVNPRGFARAASLDLDVRTSDGNVVAQGVSGKIQIDTGDGNVTANNIRGDIRMHTGDGHIEGHSFDGSLDADTGDGNLRVDGRFDALALKTGDGSIDAQVCERLEGGERLESAFWRRAHYAAAVPAI